LVLGAATAQAHGLMILSGNVKRFKPICGSIQNPSPELPLLVDARRIRRCLWKEPAQFRTPRGRICRIISSIARCFAVGVSHLVRALDVAEKQGVPTARIPG